MALRQLLIQKKLRQKNTMVTEIRKALKEFEPKESQLRAALEEAQTDEDMDTVSESIDELEKEIEAKKKEETDIKTEIDALEKELADLEAKEPGNEDDKTGGEERKMAKTIQTRDAAPYLSVRESMKVPEVRSFYEGLSNAIAEKRALSATEQVIPEIVLTRIESKLGDYSVLYDEVDVIPLKGKGRIVVDGAIPEAIWIEMTGAVQEVADGFDAVELDGFGLAGYVPVPNSTIEDAIINLASFVEDRLAKSIAKSIDKAILKGAGAASKQPDGVVPKLSEDHKVESSGKLADIIPHLGLVDTDGTEGEVIAVMNRVTYYKRIMPQLIATTDDGKTVVPNASEAMLPGLRVKLSAYADIDTIIFGAFKRYTLSQRAAIRIESSRDVKFIEDQTVFKGVGRYDGKPSKPSAFALITITDTVEETPKV